MASPSTPPCKKAKMSPYATTGNSTLAGDLGLVPPGAPSPSPLTPPNPIQMMALQEASLSISGSNPTFSPEGLEQVGIELASPISQPDAWPVDTFDYVLPPFGLRLAELEEQSPRLDPMADAAAGTLTPPPGKWFTDSEEEEVNEPIYLDLPEVSDQEGHEDDAEEPELVAGGTQEEATSSNGPAKRTGFHTYHHVLRFCANQAFFESIGKNFDCFALTLEALDSLKEAGPKIRTHAIGRSHKAGDRSEAIDAGSNYIELQYKLPDLRTDIDEDDFISGFEFGSNVTKWLQKYCARKHLFQKARGDTVQVQNYIIAPQLDSDGQGAHIHIMSRGRSFTTKADAKAWTDQVCTDLAVHFLGVPFERIPAQACRTIRIADRNMAGHVGYSCHSHENPWPAVFRGWFTHCSAQNHRETFLQWQDQVHQDRHINTVDKDIANITCFAGDEIKADKVERCARDIEKLISKGLVKVLAQGLDCTSHELFRKLLGQELAAGYRIPRMSEAKQKLIINIVCSRNAPEVQALQRSFFAEDTFTNVPAPIQNHVDTVLRGPAKDRYPALVVFDPAGGKGKSQYFLSLSPNVLYYKQNINWNTWNAQRKDAQFCLLDDVDFLGKTSNINVPSLQKSILNGAPDFDICSDKGAKSHHLIHGLPVVVLTNERDLFNFFSTDVYWQNHTVTVELTENLY
jgi:hypothetical protein